MNRPMSHEKRSKPRIRSVLSRSGGALLLCALLLQAAALVAQAPAEACTSVATLDCVQFLGRDVCTVWEEAGGAFDSPLRQVVDYRFTQTPSGQSDTELITAGGAIVSTTHIFASGTDRLLAETTSEGRTVTIDLLGSQLTLTAGTDSATAQQAGGGGPLGQSAPVWTVSEGFDQLLARNSKELYLAQIALRKNESVYPAREILGFFEGAGGDSSLPPSMPADCALQGDSGLRGGYATLVDEATGQPVRMEFVDHLGSSLSYVILLPTPLQPDLGLRITSPSGSTLLTLPSQQPLGAGERAWLEDPPGSLELTFQDLQTQRNAKLLYAAASPGLGKLSASSETGSSPPGSVMWEPSVFQREVDAMVSLIGPRLYECRPGCQLEPLDNLIIDGGRTGETWSTGTSRDNCVERLNHRLDDLCAEVADLGVPDTNELSHDCRGYNTPEVICASLPFVDEIACYCSGDADLARYSVCDGRNRNHSASNPSTVSCCNTQCPCPPTDPDSCDPVDSFTCRHDTPPQGGAPCGDFRHQACQLDPTFCGVRHELDPICVITGYVQVGEIRVETAGPAVWRRIVRVQVSCGQPEDLPFLTTPPELSDLGQPEVARVTGDWAGDGPTVYIRPGPLNEGPVSGSVEVKVVARDDFLGISQVKFWVDGRRVELEGFERRVFDPFTCLELPSANCDPNSRFQGHLDVSQLSPGAHRLDVVAFNRRGTPGPIYSYNWQDFTVEGTCNDTVRPTVSIVSPAADAVVTGTTTVQVDAADDGGVSIVTFFVDGERQLGHDDDTSPYTYSFDSTQWADGQHTLTARAYDACGNNRLSAGVRVTTDNAPNRELRFLPSDDAWVGQDPQHADSTFGWANFLRVRTDTTGEGRLSYMRFHVTGTGGSSILSARLRLRTQEQLVRSVRVYKATGIGAWSEDTLTWNNQPAVTIPSLVGEMPFLSPDEWHEIDLGGAVSGDGTINLILDSTRQTGQQDVWSKESVIYQPELIIELSN